MARDAERGQDADDWFAGDDDDDAPPHRAAVSDQNASAPGASEDWLDEADTPARAGGGPWPTSTKLAVAGVVLVAALVLGLLLGGVFEPDKPAATTPITTTPATTTRPTTTATTTTTPAAVPVPTEQLAFGDRGAEVSKLQRALTRAGYPVAVDGVYGDDTKTAVKDLQADADLPQDGIAGPQTLAALRTKLAGA